MDKNIIIQVICMIAIITGAYVLGSVNFLNINNFNIKLTGYSEINNCSNLSLDDTSECLRDELMTFFKFNLSQVGKKLTNEQLKESGAVCEQYSDWYEDNLINLGFKTKTIDIEGDDIAHRITLAWNSELNGGNYCMLDQLNYQCFQMGEINITKLKELTNEI